MTRIVFVLGMVTVSAGVAAAEPASPDPRGMIGGGVLLANDQFVDAGLALEGAVRLAETPLFVRVLGSLGGAADVEGGGSFQRIVGGIEASSCRARRGFCVFAGLDVGYQHQTWGKGEGEMDEDHRGVLVGPRFGFDAGSESTRFRMSIDLPRYRHESSVSDTRWQPSNGVTLSVVRRL